MTNTIISTSESTLQSLYRYYTEIKSTWYKGKYTNEQEDAYYKVFDALQNALQVLPIQCAEDRKVKLQFLKHMIAFPMETNTGVDFSKAENLEIEALGLVDQLAASIADKIADSVCDQLETVLTGSNING